MKSWEFQQDSVVYDNGWETVNPIVSVVMPTYCRNAEGLLDKCVQSVLNQDYRDLEFVVIDDGSTDGTQQKMIDYAEKDCRIVYIRHETNSGLPGVRSNEGILHTRGKYIAFMFDDNVWKENYLSVLMKAMKEYPADVQHSITQMIDLNDRTFKMGVFPTDTGFLELLNTIPNGAVLFKKEVFNRIGLNDPHLVIRRLSDWDLWRRAWLKGVTFHYVPEILGTEYGPASPVSLGRSIKLDYKITYAYMVDYNTLDERCRALLPENIMDYDIFDMTKLLPYVRNTSEWDIVKKIVYDEFFSNKPQYRYDDITSNRMTVPGSDKSTLPNFSKSTVLGHKKRILLACNYFNETIALWQRELSTNGDIVLPCGEWQISGYAPEEVDALLLFDAMFLAVSPVIQQFRNAGVLVIYISKYGPELCKRTEKDFENNPVIEEVFQCHLYFPRPGIGWEGEEAEYARRLIGLSDFLVMDDGSAELPFETDTPSVQVSDFTSRMELLITLMLRARIQGRCCICINSSMVSGSECYGLMCASVMTKMGLDVCVLVPERNDYGKDNDISRLTLRAAEYGLPAPIPAPFQAGGILEMYQSGVHLERIERLVEWFSTNNTGLVISCAYIPDIALATARTKLPNVFALFQPTAYDYNEVGYLSSVADAVITDSQWAADLWKRLLECRVTEIPSMVRDLECIVQINNNKIGRINIAVGGTIQPRKHQLEAVIALDSLLKKGFDLSMNLYGYELELLKDYNLKLHGFIEKNSLSDRIQFCGLAEMSVIYANNDILLSASPDESMPQTMLYAMANGLIPVACPSGGIDEFVVDEETGFMARGFTCDDIAQALERAITNTKNWPNMRKKAKEHVLKKCGETIFTETMLTVLNEACTRAEARRSAPLSNISQRILQANISPSNTHFSEKPIESDYLIYSKPIKKSRTYNVVCPYGHISRIGVLFATERTCLGGEVCLTVRYRNIVLRTSKLQIENLNLYGGWNYFAIEPLEFCGVRTLTLTLSFSYSGGYGIGVYEDSRQRSLVFRILNKLGIPPKGKNLLYTDMR